LDKREAVNSRVGKAAMTVGSTATNNKLLNRLNQKSITSNQQILLRRVSIILVNSRHRARSSQHKAELRHTLLKTHSQVPELSTAEPFNLPRRLSKHRWNHIVLVAQVELAEQQVEITTHQVQVGNSPHHNDTRIV
ncbi:MAG TPA: hypothetical protein DHW38_16075, partial [Planctomycetaceae bacterium]|nr:hypothetical protein [Planctomycetaceae bacterium]